MEQFGPYVLVRRLATGGMSEVYVALPQGAPPGTRPLVLKRLLSELEKRPDVVDMFLTEADVTALLKHPNIVQVFDSGEAEGRYYIVMEMVDGPDLAEIQRAAYDKGIGIGMGLAIYACCEALDGLDYVHRATSPSGRSLGIIHRDISPENLFCTRSGVVKVADFGIAKLSGLEGFTSLSVGVKGKLSFMAPEQIRGEPLDGRTDMFAVALILYELTTGRRAYSLPADGNEMALMERVREADITAPRKIEKEIPARLSRVLMKALSVNPRSRFKTCDDFAAALREVARLERLQSGPAELAGLIQELFPAPGARPSPPAGA